MPVARSLGRAGISVYALGARSDAARFSRYCETFVDLGAGEGVQERWLSWLLRSAPRGSVLLPCADDGLELIARHRALLSENGLRAVDVDDRVVLAMLDKAHTYELAQDVGIPFPTSIVLSDDTDIHNAAEQMRFPCAMKPIESHHFARHFGVKALIVKDSAELYDAHRRTQALGMRMMLTDIIPGDDDQLVAYFSYLDDRGEPVFDFTSRKLRQFPPGFGLATYSLQAWEVEVAEVALRFLRGIGLRGLSYTEFKRDPRDGQLKLIECNNRFTIEMHGFHVDVPLFVYKRALGEGGAAPERVPGVSSQTRVKHSAPVANRPDIEPWYLWNPLPDVVSYFILRREGRITFREWIRSLRRPLHLYVFQWRDIGPTLGVSFTRSVDRYQAAEAEVLGEGGEIVGAQCRGVTGRSVSGDGSPWPPCVSA